jgi:glycosyltransferase involved in cell wall biosynthesis
MNKLPCILQISPNEGPDGATKLVLDLHHSYRLRGYPSYIAVGRKDRNDDHVFLIPNQKHLTPWMRFWKRIESQLIALHHSDTAKIPAAISRIKRTLQQEFGIENFDFPGTYDVLQLPPDPPDIVHVHNLHLDYFDLRALPWLSRQKPMILTMHDAWLLSGHCAHAIGCDRWMTGCGKCPDLQIYPSMKRDATAYNWRRKKRIYENSSLYVAVPSQWLKRKVERSILSPAVIETRVIPYGVDLTVFQPVKKSIARGALNIPQDKPVLLLRAKSLKTKNNYWLDFRTAQTVVDTIAAQSQLPVTIIVVGEDRPNEQIGQSEIRYIPYLKDHRALAPYYQAADVFFHPARADNFPLVILEALACGTVVVSTPVCGIPEQIIDGETGFLTTPGDPKSMIDCISRLLSDPEICSQMGQNAANDASKRFDQERHVNDYLDWYGEILEARVLSTPAYSVVGTNQ